MALFQPTNVIPSTLTNSGTVSVADNMQVQWQVNGNSAMTAFQIDFYLNDYASTPVASTGKLPKQGETQAQYGLPFYGTDRFGNPQFFTYNAGISWDDKDFSDGNNYKLKITQFYSSGSNEYTLVTETSIIQGNSYYFSILNKEGVTIYINFQASQTLPFEQTIVYNIKTKRSYLIIGNDRIGFNSVESTTPIGRNLGEASNEISIRQTSESSFITRSKPTLNLFTTDDNYNATMNLLTPDFVCVKSNRILQSGDNCFFEIADTKQYVTFILPEVNEKAYLYSSEAVFFYKSTEEKVMSYCIDNGKTIEISVSVVNSLPSVGENLGTAYPCLQTSIGYFHADYEQAQGDSVRWVRWQIASANNGVVGDMLSDTGDIYTPTLNYEYNGFFNGQQYAIRCQVETESGVLADTDWIFFNIEYTESTYTGNFTVQCLPKENAALLEWEGITVIPHTVSPEGYQPTLSNGSVTLLPKNQETGEEYSITWKKVGIGDKLEDMNFSTPWTAVWKGKIEAGRDWLLQDFQAGTFSPNGDILIYSTLQQNYIYDVKNGYLTYQGYISSGVEIVTYTSAAFSPDGKYLVLSEKGAVSLWLVSENRIEYITNVLNKSGQNILAYSIVFSPTNSRLFVVDGALYSILESATSVTTKWETDLLIDGNSGWGIVANMAFSPNGRLLVVGYQGTNSTLLNLAAVFNITGTTANWVNNLTAEGQELNGAAHIAFSPNGSLLVIGGGAFNYNAPWLGHKANKITLFSVDASDNILYLSQTETEFEDVGTLAFSPDGMALVVGGKDKDAQLYTVNNNQIIYLKDITTSKSSRNALNGFFSKNSAQAMLVVGQVAIYFASPYGKIFELVLSTNILKINQLYDVTLVFLNDSLLTNVTVPTSAQGLSIGIMPTVVNAYFYGANGLISQSSTPINYTQQPITSVSIYGGDSGATVDSVSVYQGNGSNILPLYKNPDFEPVWNTEEYKLYMTANFNGNLEGGTGTASGDGFRIYRQEVGKNILIPIATTDSSTTSLKDYGLSSRKAYKYSLYAYDSNSAFMGGVESDNVVSTCFKNYSLLVCDYDEDNDEYHVRKQYLFALNLSESGISNNNSPTLNKNFTPYPTRMGDTANYASGTLSGLIGAIYTVPALIEQIGNYKHTTKPSTMDYFDNVDLEKELFDLSVSPYQLFLRDMKGHLRMIATSSPITMTTNIKQRQQSITMSLPWVEIGDASDVTIIQTPDDYGWNNDNQVLDVTLDVDVDTGELSATYPYPYNGTKFYLTGVNKESLTAKTPIEVTPAQFNLSDVAERTTDGAVTATVTVNSETDTNKS